MLEKNFKSVQFDDDNKQLQILNGKSVTINYDDIAKVSI